MEEYILVYNLYLYFYIYTALLIYTTYKSGKINKQIFFLFLANHKQAVLCAEILLNPIYFGNDASKMLQYLNAGRKTTKQSPLHKAAIHGNSGLIEFFISKGANAMQTDYTNSTVLHLTVDNGKNVVLKSLYGNGARFKGKDHVFQHSLFYAVV